MPNEDITTITHFKAYKWFCNAYEVKEFPPTSRAVLGTRNLPKISPFKPI
jgi:hypothetical protein